MITNDDKTKLLNAISLSNKEFMSVIIDIFEAYEDKIFESDLAILTDKEKSRKLFKHNYPILLEIDPTKDKTSQIYISGQDRYYPNKKCVIKGKAYFCTSQLYGKEQGATHQDNRTPLWKWVCEKFNVETDNKEDNKWWPSQEQYPLNLTKEDWKKYILEIELPEHLQPMKMLKGMMELGGEATCKQLSETYGSSPNTYSGCAMNFGRRVKKYFNLPSCMDGEQERYYPFPFVGKYRGGRKDNYLYRIRPELQEALKEIDLSNIDPHYERGEEQLSAQEQLQHINTYIAGKGYTFDEDMIANYYLSLKSKPFVILAGTSGTGKTKLVELFAEAIGATYDNGQYLLVPVRPDWSDSTDLFGYMNLNGEFVPGAIIDFICEANMEENKDKPYFLCLDEMNLARVEYYLSDILSVIETRKNDEEGRIRSISLLPKNFFSESTKIAGKDEHAKDKYRDVHISDNLYIIGTVNMDETTFPFSKKVLDRANTIEFSAVDTLVPNFDKMKAESNNLGEWECMVSNEFLRPKYTQIADCADMKEMVEAHCKVLQELNTILAKAELHVGYRVRDEIEFYLLYSQQDKILKEDDAIDNQIMQKILPRIQGSGMQIVTLLEELTEFCGSKYMKSKKKLEAMKERCGEYGEGYTSYWL